ncbi:MAG: hypothetical protein K6T59_17430, partial [Bryobacteraceae bacterium]|nr:hypothetical protein [Bryobacteraceae bacterium]
RFLSEDPLGIAAGDANLSRYVLNSPPNYTDPTGMKPGNGMRDAGGCCDCCCCCDGADALAAEEDPAFMPYDMNVMGPIMQGMVNQMMLQQQEQMRAHSPPVGSGSEEGRGFWKTLWHEAKSVAAASYRLIPFSKPFVQVYDFVSSYRAQGGDHWASRVARAASEAMDTPLGAIAYSGVQNWRNTAGSNLVYRLYVTIAGPAGEMFLAGRAATVIEGRDADGNRYTKGGRAAHGLLLVGEFGLTVYGGRGLLTPIGCLRRCTKVLRAPKSSGTACAPLTSGGRWRWGYNVVPDSEAAAAYQAIRESTTDVAAIARYTGYKLGRIQRIKDYLFNNPEWTGADAEIAAAWHRLRTGRGTDVDRLLLKHETAEMFLRRRYGLDYCEAHRRANQHWNWERALEEQRR